MPQTLHSCDFPIKSYDYKSEYVLNFSTKRVNRFIFLFLKFILFFKINIFYFNLKIINNFSLIIVMVDFIIEKIEGHFSNFIKKDHDTMKKVTTFKDRLFLTFLI